MMKWKELWPWKELWYKGEDYHDAWISENYAYEIHHNEEGVKKYDFYVNNLLGEGESLYVRSYDTLEEAQTQGPIETVAKHGLTAPQLKGLVHYFYLSGAKAVEYSFLTNGEKEIISPEEYKGLLKWAGVSDE